MHDPLIFLATVIAAGIGAQWLAWRLKLPSILLLLMSGFILGFGIGVNPDDVLGRDIIFPVVSLSVAVIMFEGGLTLKLREIEKARDVVIRLVTFGVLVCWGIATAAIILILGVSWQVGAITGAVLTVTGPTVVGPMLRHIRPKKAIGSVIKWEGIVIDPVGAVLAVLVFEAVTSYHGPLQITISLLAIVLIGAMLGFGSAYLLVQSIRRFVIPDFLQVPLTLTVVVVVFVFGNNLAHEAGLVAVTLMGIAMGNQRAVSIRHLLEFKENLQILLISCLFVVLAARIEISDIWRLGWGGIALLVVMIVVVRPASVLVSTIGSKLDLNERIFLAALAPRGIVAAVVASVFTLELAEHHTDAYFEDANLIASITFLVIVGTVSVYGLVAGPIARRLGLAIDRAQGVLFAGATELVRDMAFALQQEGIPVLLVDTNHRNVTEARLAGVPATCDSIVSEFVSEEMELGGIGRLLAMTPNDELNSLAATELSSVFGRSEVYQLGASQGGVGNRTKPSHLLGRTLFNGITFADLQHQHLTGAQLKKTTITDEFGYDSFLDRYGESTQLLFVVSASKQLRINSVDDPIIPTAGDTVIAMIS